MMPPLAVDLDGTLVKTDVLLESFLSLIKQHPLSLLLMPFWLIRGRAYLKRQVAARVTIDVNVLPYHKQFLVYLKKQKQRGRELVLATAADRLIAEKIAEHLGLFNHVIASDVESNLTGKAKLKAIRSYYKGRPFDYAANSKVDLPVWQACRLAIVVNGSASLVNRVKKIAKVTRVFGRTRHPFLVGISALRPYQWLKNLLIFLPMLMAHQIDVSVSINTILAFVSFSLCASSVYIINDLLDLESDRRHPRKRQRPFAAGRLSLHTGFFISTALAISGFSIALLLPERFILTLGLYYLVTTLYSLSLKRIAMFDAIALAGLYTLRVIAGAEAGGVEVSFWLLVSSMFIFSSLAMVKRTSELYDLRSRRLDCVDGRGYQGTDLEVLARFGAAAGFLSVLVLAQYINSDEVVMLYNHPKVLWLVCPLLMYWICRLWLYTERGKMHDDPIIFTLRDRGSISVILLALLVIYIAL